MGMHIYLKAITATKAKSLLQGHPNAEEQPASEENLEIDDLLDLGRVWPYLHDTFTGVAWDTNSILQQAILGGTSIMGDSKNDLPERLLMPEQVK